MSKPAIGIAFEGVLYRGTLGAVDPPLLSQRPSPGAILFLIELVQHFNVTVYPMRQAPGRAAELELWLLRQAHAWFSAEDVPDPHQSSVDLVDVLAVTDHRPVDGIRVESDSLDGGEQALPTLAQLLRQARRAA